jgi:hypothetical protein
MELDPILQKNVGNTLIKYLQSLSDLIETKGLELVAINIPSAFAMWKLLKEVLYLFKSISSKSDNLTVFPDKNDELIIGQTNTNTTEKAVVGTVESRRRKFPKVSLDSNAWVDVLDKLLVDMIRVEKEMYSFPRDPEKWLEVLFLKDLTFSTEFPESRNTADRLESEKEIKRLNFKIRQLRRKKKKGKKSFNRRKARSKLASNFKNTK